MKIHSGHIIEHLSLTADLQFFRGNEIEDDYEVSVPYTCPALGWSAWVSKSSVQKEKADVVEKFDYMVLNRDKEPQDLKNKLRGVLESRGTH